MHITLALSRGRIVALKYTRNGAWNLEKQVLDEPQLWAQVIAHGCDVCFMDHEWGKNAFVRQAFYKFFEVLITTDVSEKDVDLGQGIPRLPSSHGYIEILAASFVLVDERYDGGDDDC